MESNSYYGYNPVLAARTVKNGGEGIQERLKDIEIPYEDIEVLNCAIYHKENDEENVEYKFKLIDIRRDKLERLITQMNFRLSEGNGTCYYILGVLDNGTPLGLPKNELIETLKVIYLASHYNEAECKILNFRDGIKGLLAEVIVIKNIKIQNKVEVKIGLIGEESSGKTTLVGVLVSGKKDDGKGLAATGILNHNNFVNEKRTSSFTHQILGFDENGRTTNYCDIEGRISWDKMLSRSFKLINFYDLGGSEKALSLSSKTLSKNYLDYLAIVIPCEITHNTFSFLEIAIKMDLPIFLIITKIDKYIDNEEVDKIINNLKKFMKEKNFNKNLLRVTKQEDVVQFSRCLNEPIIPVIKISSTKKIGYEVLTSFLNMLPNKLPQDFVDNCDSTMQFDVIKVFYKKVKIQENKRVYIKEYVSKQELIKQNTGTYNENNCKKLKKNKLNKIKINNSQNNEINNNNTLNSINNIIEDSMHNNDNIFENNSDNNDLNNLNNYSNEKVEVITIVAGILSEGSIYLNSINNKTCPREYYLGPNLEGKFEKVLVKSIHCKKIPVKSVYKGQFCFLEIESSKIDIRKGMVLVNELPSIKASKSFEAEIWNIGDKEIKISINKTNYVVSSGHIRQSATVRKVFEYDENTSVIVGKEEIKSNKNYKIKNFLNFITLGYDDFNKDVSDRIELHNQNSNKINNSIDKNIINIENKLINSLNINDKQTQHRKKSSNKLFCDNKNNNLNKRKTSNDDMYIYKKENSRNVTVNTILNNNKQFKEYTIGQKGYIKVVFEFEHYSEFIKVGSHLLILGNNIKLYGRVINLIT